MLSWNTCGTYFSTPIYLTETGTILLICFCYYYEFIITITLSIWSDKRCCKKVRWKNKKIRLAVFFLQSKLLFFYIKNYTTYLTPHRLKLHTIFFGVNFEPRIFKFFLPHESKKPIKSPIIYYLAKVLLLHIYFFPDIAFSNITANSSLFLNSVSPHIMYFYLFSPK